MAGYWCEMFGGYPVESGQVCDSFERGKPGTERDEDSKYERPHHLHESTGTNHCRQCTYYWAEETYKISAKSAAHIRHKVKESIS